MSDLGMARQVHEKLEELDGPDKGKCIAAGLTGMLYASGIDLSATVARVRCIATRRCIPSGSPPVTPIPCRLVMKVTPCQRIS